MRLLDRYLLRELLIPLSYCLGGFLVFWMSYDIFMNLGEFQRGKLKLPDVLEYYLVKTPEMLSVVLPVALLLASLYALSNHARFHELTAIRAAGVSLWRLSFPYIAVGVLFSIGLFLVNEFWVPETQERTAEIMYRNVEGKREKKEWKKNLFFRNATANRSWNIEAYNIKTGEMLKPTLIWELPDRTKRVVHAARAHFTNDSWIFFEVQETISSPGAFFPTRNQTNEIVFSDFSENPDLIRSDIKVNTTSLKEAAKRAQFSIEEILNYFRLHPRVPKVQAAMLKTQLHARVASPWTCLIVVLIAIPFGAPSGRRNVFVGVAGSVFICFFYFILFRLGLSLGTGGYVPAWVAAWLPNIMFAAVGVILTARVR
jgi:lipopolysaccharide export system permease protein